VPDPNARLGLKRLGGDAFAEAVRLRDAARDFIVGHCGELDLTGG